MAERREWVALRRDRLLGAAGAVVAVLSAVAIFVVVSGEDDGPELIPVIPEPATLGMVAVFGAGILFVRRRFMI